MDTEAKATAPFVREPAAGSTLNVLGITQIHKATGAETAGAFSLWEAVVPPGAGAPPHTHTREDEAFYVLSGELLIEFEGEPAPRQVATGGFFSAQRTGGMLSVMSATGRHASLSSAYRAAASTRCLRNCRRPQPRACRNSASWRPSPKNMGSSWSRLPAEQPDRMLRNGACVR